MTYRPILNIGLITGCILLIPLVAMQFTSEVVWTLSDFVIAGILIFGTGLIYELGLKKIPNPKIRPIFILLLGILFIYIWAELAVGIFNIPGISGS